MEKVNFTSFLLGWLFGIAGTILSTLFLDWTKTKSKRRELTAGIIAEFEEIRLRLTYNLFTINLRYGELTKEQIDWTMETFSSYDEDRVGKEIIRKIRDLKNRDETEFRQAMEYQKREQEMNNTTINVKELNLTFLDSNIGFVGLLNTKCRGKLLEIKTKMDLLNSEVRIHNNYCQLSFQAEGDNHLRIIKNSDTSIKSIAYQSKQIADDISHLLEQLR